MTINPEIRELHKIAELRRGQAQEVPELSEAPPVVDDRHPRPVIISFFNPMTNQGGSLETLDASQLDWLKATLAMLRSLPAPPCSRNQGSSLHGETTPAVRPGPKGYEIMVLSVDRNEYTGPWGHGKIFDNANQASKELGYSYNVVNKGFKMGEEGFRTSTTNGVTFCYQDEYIAHLNAVVSDRD